MSRQDASVVGRVLWLNGTVGSGKSTVGPAVAARLAQSGETTAFVATDALGAVWPRSAEDPFNTQVVARNLEAVATVFAAAGVRSLVIGGVMESQDELALFRQAVQAPVTIVRLVVPIGDLEARLRMRHGDIDPSGLQWHLDRAPTLTAILDEAGLPMTDVLNVGHPEETASAVLAAAQWAFTEPDHTEASS